MLGKLGTNLEFFKNSFFIGLAPGLAPLPPSTYTEWMQSEFRHSQTALFKIWHSLSISQKVNQSSFLREECFRITTLFGQIELKKSIKEWMIKQLFTGINRNIFVCKCYHHHSCIRQINFSIFYNRGQSDKTQNDWVLDIHHQQVKILNQGFRQAKLDLTVWF